MGLDIRLPIGMMFTLVGLILVITGLISSDAETLKRSLDLNVNLWWGAFLVLFGGMMLLLAMRARGKAETDTK